MKVIALALLAVFHSCSAFTSSVAQPSSVAAHRPWLAHRPVQHVNQITAMSRFDDQLWDFNAKKAIYDDYDPNAKRTADNFNPFERNTDGNACDPNGKFPGEGGYKDPMRPDVSFAQMQADKAALETITSNPKAGDVAGAPGRWKD